MQMYAAVRMIKLIAILLVVCYRSSLFFYQSTVLSTGAADGHQMYFGGLVVGKASTIGIDYRDLAHPSPNFHRGSKSAKFGVG